MHTDILLVKAFTKDPDHGNPAGVILDARGLSDAQMINTAGQLGFSESAFVTPSEQADFKIRFFTPTQEVDLCGHATIATFHALLSEGIIQVTHQNQQFTQETGAGIIRVTLKKDGLIVMHQSEPTFYEEKTDRNAVVHLLGLSEADLLDYPIQSVSTGGAPKLIIPVKSLDLLHGIQPDLPAIAEYSRESEARGFYPFTPETIDKESDFHARQFNPLAGINEDPITGIAGGSLGSYAREYGLSDKDNLIIEQGYILNKGGKMYVDLSKEVSVGGYGCVFGRCT